MPDFAIVNAPIKSPGLCAACGQHGGPMIDTGVELEPPHGALYLCVTCVTAWADRLGWRDPDYTLNLLETLEKAAEQVRDLTIQLEQSEANQTQVVSLDDARRLIAPLDMVGVPAESATGKTSKRG